MPVSSVLIEVAIVRRFLIEVGAIAERDVPIACSEMNADIRGRLQC